MSEQEFIVQNAQNLMSMGEYEEGIKLLRELGDYPLALRLLGYAYYNGDGVEENHNKALEYFVSAYEHGETDPGFYELIHELVCDNLSNYKRTKCNFKAEIEPLLFFLRTVLDIVKGSPLPSDNKEDLQELSQNYTNAVDFCCEIIKVFIQHQGKNDELPLHLLFLEAMKMGLVELEFISIIKPFYELIEKGDLELAFRDPKQYIPIPLVINMFVETVEEVINNKSNKDIIREIFEKNAKKEC